MNTVTEKKTLYLFLLFFFSALFFLMSGLLFTWGTPQWFQRLPSASGFRFLLALEVFFLCSLVLCFIQLLLFLAGKKEHYWLVFLCSFVPVPVFSFLILSGYSLQIVQEFTSLTDIAAWSLLVVLLFLIPRNSFFHDELYRAFRVWSVCCCFQVCMATLSLFSLLPAVLIIAVRFIILLLSLVLTVQSIRFPASDALLKTARRFSLTPRETEVLALLLEGKTNNEIADTLCISLSTVKMHVARIFDKTGAKNRLEAVVLCGKS